MYSGGGVDVDVDGIWCKERINLILDLLSNLYSELDAISVDTSRPSSCSILYCLPTLLTTAFKRTVNDFSLKRLFYSVTNFIQLVSPLVVDWFLQTKLHCKAPNEGYLHIYGIYKSNNTQLRYQAISNYKSFIG